MAGPNIFESSLEYEDEEAGFFRRTAFIGRHAGAERLGATLYELPPDRTAFPYHLHYANEELLVVVAGHPSLRTPEGWRQLKPGEVAAFPVGERGAHQVSNFSSASARYLIASEMRGPELCVYPDSGKVSARERAPGPGADGPSGDTPLSRRRGLLDGEEPPGLPSG